MRTSTNPGSRLIDGITSLTNQLLHVLPQIGNKVVSSLSGDDLVMQLALRGLAGDGMGSHVDSCVEHGGLVDYVGGWRLKERKIMMKK